MAFDIGQKRTGIAVTDPSQIIASALNTIDTHKLTEFLKQYLQLEPVEKLVLGLPVDLQNQPSSNQPLVLQMIGKIKKMFPELPIETHDERFTSSLAKQTVLASGINKKARRQKENMDKISATLILQSYMEQTAMRKA